MVLFQVLFRTKCDDDDDDDDPNWLIFLGWVGTVKKWLVLQEDGSMESTAGKHDCLHIENGWF